MEFGNKSVKDRCGGFVPEQVGVKEVLSLDDLLGVLFLDQVVKSICRTEILRTPIKTKLNVRNTPSDPRRDHFDVS